MPIFLHKRPTAARRVHARGRLSPRGFDTHQVTDASPHETTAAESRRSDGARETMAKKKMSHGSLQMSRSRYEMTRSRYGMKKSAFFTL